MATKTYASMYLIDSKNFEAGKLIQIQYYFFFFQFVTFETMEIMSFGGVGIYLTI